MVKCEHAFQCWAFPSLLALETVSLWCVLKYFVLSRVGVAYIYNPSIWKAAIGELPWIQGHPELKREFQISLGYNVGPCLKNKDILCMKISLCVQSSPSIPPAFSRRWLQALSPVLLYSTGHVAVAVIWHWDQGNLETEEFIWLTVPEGKSIMAGEAWQRAAGTGNGKSSSPPTCRKQRGVNC